MKKTMHSREKMIAFIVVCQFIMIACNSKKTNEENYLQEIEKTEKDFNASIAALGVAEAFALYADSNAVILRGNDSLIKGRSAIRNYYSRPVFNGASVKWAPDFSEVSANGDMAYSYGKYVWLLKDSTGKESVYKGLYHTIWKKQPDGSWKYVWD
jgi:ketosteroid isomerase-like protein